MFNSAEALKCKLMQPRCLHDIILYYIAQIFKAYWSREEKVRGLLRVMVTKNIITDSDGGIETEEDQEMWKTNYTW